jgi:hypothetical protein
MLDWVSEKKMHTDDELYYYNDERGGFAAYRYFFKRRYFGENGQRILLEKMAELDEACYRKLENCDYIVVTLGTTRIVRMNANGTVINTVSGIPVSEWNSENLSVQDNVDNLERIFNAIRCIRRKDLPTIFLTISPQRYLFSTGVPGCENISPFLDNMLGKSILRVAVEEFISNHKQDNIFYFPAYELVIDELRQYESLSTYDYVHIEQNLTPKYVVKRFLKSYCSDSLLKNFSRIDESKSISLEFDDLLEGGMSPDDKYFSEKFNTFLKKLIDELGGAFWPFQLSFPLMNVLIKQGKPEKVLEYFGAADLHPTARSKIAEILVDLGQYEEARLVCEEIIIQAQSGCWQIPNTQKRCENLLDKINQKIVASAH